MRRWDAETGAYVDVQSVWRRNENGLMVDAQSVRVWDGNTWREVWPKRLYLYKEGDKCENVTGSWTDFRTRNNTENGVVFPMAVFAETYIQFSGTDNVYGWGSKATFTNRKIAIGKYMKLCMEVEAECINTETATVIGLASQNITWGIGDNPEGDIIKKGDADLVKHLTHYIIEVDISSLVMQAYVYVKGYGHANTVKIKNIWLEP